MLRYLQIRDFAIIDSVELELQRWSDGSDRRDRRRQVHHRRCTGAAGRWSRRRRCRAQRCRARRHCRDYRYFTHRRRIAPPARRALHRQCGRAGTAARDRQRRPQPRLARRPVGAFAGVEPGGPAAIRYSRPARISIAGTTRHATGAGRRLRPARVAGRPGAHRS